MSPAQPLPHSAEFTSTTSYIDALLAFATSSTLFQTLCGGVHILDFFTSEPGIFERVIPTEWQPYLLSISSATLLDLLMRDDLTLARDSTKTPSPPDSLLEYISEIRKLNLCRDVRKGTAPPLSLPRHVSVGMIPKKIHEVSSFASYVALLCDELSEDRKITHVIDFGSGQNYLGRALASPPWNRHVVAVESRTVNIDGAKHMDVLAGVAEREKVMRNKKVFRKQELDREVEQGGLVHENHRIRVNKDSANWTSRAQEKFGGDITVDLRSYRDLSTTYTPPGEGQGFVQYVQQRLENGDLKDVIRHIETTARSEDCNSPIPSVAGSAETTDCRPKVSALALSIHSCGNLSHHGIRSLILNPSVSAIAIIGCCYNLLTPSLPPRALSEMCEHKHPLLRPDLPALNAFLPTPDSNSGPTPAKPQDQVDPHGFPMSTRFRTHGPSREGIRFNISARSMAVQAPHNWTSDDSERFFERHYWRALLQKMMLDHGVVRKVAIGGRSGDDGESGGAEPIVHLPRQDGICDVGRGKNFATEPIIIGTLRKSCFRNGFKGYVDGALDRLLSRCDEAALSTNGKTHEAHDNEELRARILAMRSQVTDEVIAQYETVYAAKRKELSAVWSLMAFSAQLVESMIVVDRWSFLQEEIETGSAGVRDAWVEAVWEYDQSPRNLVVVGVK